MDNTTGGPAPRVESLGHFEMLWDCGHCDAKKLLGVTHRHCPNCGAPQDETKRYFPSDADKIKVENHVYTGVDRKCASCGAAQSAKAEHCGKCGAPLGEGKAVPLVSATPKVAAPAKGWFRWWMLLAIVALFALLIWRCTRTKTVEMKVTGHRWAVVQPIEEFREVGEEAWRNEVPSGARQQSCSRKQRSTKAVPDGEDCHVEKVDKGDGTFEEVKKCTPRTRQEGVDDDFCSYRIDRWTEVDSLKAQGTGLDIKPPVVPPSPVQSGLGARRAGSRSVTWILDLHDGKKARTCDVSEGAWKKYADGQAIKAKVRVSSGELVCGAL